MISIFINDTDYLVTGNNDGIILIWELVVTEELQAKPYLLKVIKNLDNPDYDLDDVLVINNYLGT